MDVFYLIPSLTGPIVPQQSKHRAATDGQREVPDGHLPLPRPHSRPQAAAQRPARLVNLPQVGDSQHGLDVGSPTEQTKIREFLLNKRNFIKMYCFPSHLLSSRGVRNVMTENS